MSLSLSFEFAFFALASFLPSAWSFVAMDPHPTDDTDRPAKIPLLSDVQFYQRAYLPSGRLNKTAQQEIRKHYTKIRGYEIKNLAKLTCSSSGAAAAPDDSTEVDDPELSDAKCVYFTSFDGAVSPWKGGSSFRVQDDHRPWFFAEIARLHFYGSTFYFNETVRPAQWKSTEDDARRLAIDTDGIISCNRFASTGGRVRGEVAGQPAGLPAGPSQPSLRRRVTHSLDFSSVTRSSLTNDPAVSFSQQNNDLAEHLKKALIQFFEDVISDVIDRVYPNGDVETRQFELMYREPEKTARPNEDDTTHPDHDALRLKIGCHIVFPNLFMSRSEVQYLYALILAYSARALTDGQYLDAERIWRLDTPLSQFWDEGQFYSGNLRPIYSRKIRIEREITLREYHSSTEPWCSCAAKDVPCHHVAFAKGDNTNSDSKIKVVYLPTSSYVPLFTYTWNPISACYSRAAVPIPKNEDELVGMYMRLSPQGFAGESSLRAAMRSGRQTGDRPRSFEEFVEIATSEFNELYVPYYGARNDGQVPAFPRRCRLYLQLRFDDDNEKDVFKESLLELIATVLAIQRPVVHRAFMNNPDVALKGVMFNPSAPRRRKQQPQPQPHGNRPQEGGLGGPGGPGATPARPLDGPPPKKKRRTTAGRKSSAGPPSAAAVDSSAGGTGVAPGASSFGLRPRPPYVLFFTFSCRMLCINKSGYHNNQTTTLVVNMGGRANTSMYLKCGCNCVDTQWVPTTGRPCKYFRSYLDGIDFLFMVDANPALRRVLDKLVEQTSENTRIELMEHLHDEKSDPRDYEEEEEAEAEGGDADRPQETTLFSSSQVQKAREAAEEEESESTSDDRRRGEIQVEDAFMDDDDDDDGDAPT